MNSILEKEVGRETIRTVLKGNEFRKPVLTKRFCIPPEANEEFVYNMEDVLDVYHRPYDLRFLSFLYWMRGVSSSLMKYGNQYLWKKGKPKREDHEYEREGTFNIYSGPVSR